MGEKVAIDLELGSGFRQALRLPPPFTSVVTTISHSMAEKSDEKQNSKFQNSISHSWDGGGG